MEQVKIASVGDTTVKDSTGRVLQRAGNAIMVVGDTVWTDGVLAYGHTYRGYQPAIQYNNPVVGIPLYGSYYNDFVHAVFDTRKSKIVQYYNQTQGISPFMVNSYNDFSQPLIDDVRGDFDADMNDKGDVYVICAGKWSFEYDTYEISHILKHCSYGTIDITATYTKKSEVRPGGYDEKTTESWSYEQHYTSGEWYNTDYYYYDIEATPSSGKGETESTAFVWKNGKKIDDFTKTFQNAINEAYDKFINDFPGDWQQEKAECEISHVRINENGETNYILNVRLKCFRLVPFDIYGTRLTRTADVGYYRYEPIPSGWNWDGEEIWWVSKEYSWEHNEHGEIENIKTGSGNGYARCNLTELWFVDEKGEKTLLTNARSWLFDGDNKKYDPDTRRYIGLGDKVFLSCKMEHHSFDEWSSRDISIDPFRPYKREDWDTVTTRSRSVDGVTEYKDTSEKVESYKNMKFMAQDGYRFDYDGNLYNSSGGKIYKWAFSDFDFIVPMVTEVNENEYLIGARSAYTGSQPPIYTLYKIKNGITEELEDGSGWWNTRLRKMKNIQKWIKGEA